MMQFGQLRSKEVICIKDGYKIGYVDDIEFDAETYQILSFICYGRGRFFGLLGRSEDIKISFEQIQVIGEDIILVTDYTQDHPAKPKKGSFWDHIFE